MLKEKYGFSDEQIRPYNFSVTPFLQNKTKIQPNKDYFLLNLLL